jgi:hypothetical protein
MLYPDKHTYNIHLKTQMKHRELTFATYVHNHCNICNILIYFCNIHLKHLQHTSETSETLKTYACNVHFSPFFFRATQSRAGNGWIQPAGGRGWWSGLVAASCTCTWPGSSQRRPPLLGGLAWAQRRTRHGIARWGTEAPQGMAAVASQSGRVARDGGATGDGGGSAASRRNREAATAEASGEFLSQRAQ